jgi:hypothetical protein
MSHDLLFLLYIQLNYRIKSQLERALLLGKNFFVNLSHPRTVAFFRFSILVSWKSNVAYRVP